MFDNLPRFYHFNRVFTIFNLNAYFFIGCKLLICSVGLPLDTSESLRTRSFEVLKSLANFHRIYRGSQHKNFVLRLMSDGVVMVRLNSINQHYFQRAGFLTPF